MEMLVNMRNGAAGKTKNFYLTIILCKRIILSVNIFTRIFKGMIQISDGAMGMNSGGKG